MIGIVTQLQNTFDVLAKDFYAHRQDATGEQIREYLRTYLDEAPISYWKARKAWAPLSTEERDAALRNAIPDGTYTRSGWVIGDELGNLLQDNNQVTRDVLSATIFTTREEAESHKKQHYSLAAFQIKRLEDVTKKLL